MKQNLTNVEFVTELMEFSRFGALAQALVIEAIQRHADRVARADPEAMSNSFLNGHAWVGVAKEIKERVDAKYGPRHREESFRASLLDVIHIADEAHVDGHEVEQVNPREKCLDEVYVITSAHEVLAVDDQEVELRIGNDHNSATFTDLSGQSHALTLRQFVRVPVTSRDLCKYLQRVRLTASQPQAPGSTDA